MAETDRPYRAGYEISGIGPDRIFAALLDIESFPPWAVGLAGVRALDAEGRETARVEPGTNLEFVLEAAGLPYGPRRGP